MNKSYLFFLVITLLIVGCNKEQDPFQVGKQHIGLLNDSTQIKEIEAIFINDSVVTGLDTNEFTRGFNDIDIFEKGGKKLLRISPYNTADSTSHIQSIQIFDPRYKTDKNISTLSTFKDISSNYKISRIDNLINTIIINVNEINASFTIDKKELPANLRFDRNLKIEETHIPDDAKIKFFFINWTKI